MRRLKIFIDVVIGGCRSFGGESSRGCCVDKFVVRFGSRSSNIDGFVVRVSGRGGSINVVVRVSCRGSGVDLII